MRNVPNPIVLTSMYTTFPGTLLPVYRDIRLKDVRSVTGGWTTLLGLDSEHRVERRPSKRARGRAAPGAGSGRARRRADLSAAREIRAARGHGDRGRLGRHARPATRVRGPVHSLPDLPEAPAAAVKVPEEDPTLYVAASGNGDYWSIQRAIDVAPAEGA